ncbi:MAG TPA: hypothetical protein VG692_14035, partial [Gemmatimonadales bacterium]|nr:hypothetical protein [Gemmatimonadales bacterium]
QESARKFASAFAPKTAFGVEFRNLVMRVLRIPALADWLVGRDLRDDITLPNYASALAPAAPGTITPSPG